jgi:hypothetical protein
VATPAIDFGAAVGDTQLNIRHYSGGIEIRNMGQVGTDTMSLEGNGQLIVAASCVGGTVAVRGNFNLTDNSGGAVTFSDDARFTKSEMADTNFDEALAGHLTVGTVGLAQALSLYEDAAIWIDTNNGSVGTVVGTNGTKNNPVNNLANAVTLAAATGFRRYNIRQVPGGLTLTSAHDDWQFYGLGEGVDIALANQDVGGSKFVGCSLSGAQNGNVIAEDCMIEDVTGMRGTYLRCRYRGTLGLFAAGSVHSDGGTSHETAGGADPIFDFAGAGAHQLHLHGFAGHVELQNMTNAADEADIELVAGQITIGATNTSGAAIIGGVGVVDDSAVGGTTVDVTGLVESERLVDDAWDELSSGHVTAGTMGALLLEASQAASETFVHQIWADDPTAGGTLTLDVAVHLNGTFTPSTPSTATMVAQIIEAGVVIHTTPAVLANAQGMFKTTIDGGDFRPTDGDTFMSICTVVDGSNTYVSVIGVPAAKFT